MRNLRNQMCIMLTHALTAALCVALIACQSKKQPQERRHKLKGKIVSVDKQARQIAVDHEDIPGLMSAMTMTYDVTDDRALGQLATGDQITADVVVRGGHSWLENIVILSKGTPSGSKPSSEFHQPQPGEEVPDFVLVNQDGKRFWFRHYRGKAVLLTFLYTRCPLPDYCPRMTSNFEEINKALMQDERAYARTRLVSISFDPKYDAPKVLREYGAAYARKNGKPSFDHWEFASLSETERKDVTRFFGLSYWPEEGQIVHSMSTALITPDGRVYRWYRGNDWKTATVLDDLAPLIRGEYR